MTNTLRAQLSAPFAPSAITWKPGASKENKCMAMAYADLRAYMERLDDICGMEWTVKYEPWGDNRIIAHLTIAGITRCSTGEMEAQDEKSGIGGTVAEAQAFKRAAAMFGLGRYLYDLPSVWVDFDPSRKRITEAGQRELDSRYKDWYKRQTSQNGPQAPKAVAQVETPVPSVQPAPRHEGGQAADIWEPEPNSEAKKPDTLSQSQMARLHTLGSQAYGAKWDAERLRLVEHISKGAISSSKELTPDEADVLIRGIEKKLATVNQNGHKVAA